MSSQRRPLPLSTRLAVLIRDNGRCVYCGASHTGGAVMTIDHVVSRKRGGSDAFDNLVAACRPCNEDKAHFGLRAYLVDLAERGVSTEGIAERVAAALAAPIDLTRLPEARALYLAQAKLVLVDEDDA